ncbi:hypothetical protein FHR81_002302 [Actinoalloteichus hoggarensis]|uniref:Uncharacterized protein n=1 Tax=Actinoalloteichus hoggarensis TaxID=1470176 RepID=A0A221W6E8_9PSEU|nr:hypothetical protein AHOG_18530 [Actinoalloteichus hoggarensis]MBB5921264.1 hypothetical protein [Actinoalloteichus hoggarensis]
MWTNATVRSARPEHPHECGEGPVRNVEEDPDPPWNTPTDVGSRQSGPGWCTGDAAARRRLRARGREPVRIRRMCEEGTRNRRAAGARRPARPVPARPSPCGLGPALPGPLR